MTSADEAASAGLSNLLRSEPPDSEARSFLFAFNLWRGGPGVAETTIDEPAGSIRLRLCSPESGRDGLSLPSCVVDRLLFSTISAQRCRRTAIESGRFRRFFRGNRPAGFGRTYDADDASGAHGPAAGAAAARRRSEVRFAPAIRGVARHHGISLPRRLVVSGDG
jgi:hypothetical protein